LLNYIARCADEPQVKLNEEAREFRWVSLTQALTMPINQPTRALLEAVAPESHTAKERRRGGKKNPNG
jgi:hypothetical protein